MYRGGERRKIFHEDETSERCFQNVGNRIKFSLKTFSYFHLVRVKDIDGAHEKLKNSL